LDDYPVVIHGGDLVVDLGAARAGPGRDAAALGPAGEQCVFLDGPVGVPSSVAHRIDVSGDEVGTWTDSTGRFQLTARRTSPDDVSVTVTR
jgi:hypothetical protein